MSDKIAEINWQDAVADVEKFLKPIEQKSLKLWSEKFYLTKIQKLDELLSS